MLATHQKSTKARHAARSLVAGVCVILLSATAQVAFAANNANTYQQDRKFCMSGQSNEDQKTCLQEAGAARAAAKNGNLTEADAAYEQNAMARCKALPAADQSDCARRVHGQGEVSGSVGAGGVIRETTTTIIESPPSGLPPSGVTPQHMPQQMHQMHQMRR